MTVNEIKIGDIVRIKTEWCDSDFDRALNWEVTNVNEVTNRYDIKTYLPGWVIPTTQVVSGDMIEKITE